MSEHFLERMTWPEVEARLAGGVDAVLLPIGTTEQHGRHMPLDTDCVIDRGEAVRAAGLPWTSLGQYGMRHSGPKVVVPMDMLRDITESGVVGDATRATGELGERIVGAVVPRIVQVAREVSGKEPD